MWWHRHFLADPGVAVHDVCTILGALLLQVADLGNAVLAYRIILEPWWLHSRRVPVHVLPKPAYSRAVPTCVALTEGPA